MKENRRVALSIFLWVALAVGFVYVGAYAFSNISMSACAQEFTSNDKVLPMASPESVDMDSRRLTRIDSIVEEYIAEGAIPGAVVGVMRQAVPCAVLTVQ